MCGRAGRLAESWLGRGEASMCVSARTSLLWPENRAGLGHRTVLGMAAGFTHHWTYRMVLGMAAGFTHHWTYHDSTFSRVTSKQGFMITGWTVGANAASRVTRASRQCRGSTDVRSDGREKDVGDAPPEHLGELASSVPMAPAAL